MKITNVETFFVNPGWGKNWLFVKVETDSGIHGWGECYTQSDRDRTIQIHVEHLGRYLIGRDPGNIKHFTQVAFDDYASRRGAMEIYSAVSGIEQALWDIKGKEYGVPVYKLLGGKYRSKLRVYANGWYAGSDTPEEYASAAVKTIEKGFTALKFDPIPGPFRSYIPKTHENQAVETVRRVREAVGDDIDLLIEVHRRLSPMHAISLARRIEEYDLYWFEEPCSPENMDAIAEVRDSISIPVVTGEALYTKAGFYEAFSKRVADIINPDVANTGGILELKEIAAMAEPQNVAVSPHNYNSTTIALASTMQACITMPNFIITEYFLPWAEIGKIICPNSFTPVNGIIEIPDTPGLGVDLNMDELAKYPYQEFNRSLPNPDQEGTYLGSWPDNLTEQS